MRVERRDEKRGMTIGEESREEIILRSGKTRRDYIAVIRLDIIQFTISLCYN